MLMSKSVLPLPSNTTSTPLGPLRLRMAAPKSSISSRTSTFHAPASAAAGALCPRDTSDHPRTPASDQLRQHATDATRGGMHEDYRALRDRNGVIAQVLCCQSLHEPACGGLEGHTLWYGDETFVRNRQHLGVAPRCPYPRDSIADRGAGLSTNRNHDPCSVDTEDSRHRGRWRHDAA